MSRFAILLAAILCCGSLSAMSIGRCGEPFFKNDVQWQPVCYENNDVGFTATVPGEPRSGLSNSNVYTYSSYDNTDYEIHCSYNQRYIPPKNSNAFMNDIKKSYEKEWKIVEVASTQKKVKYIAELYHNTENKIVRAYSSHNCLYWALVEGDLSLAQQFFDSIVITH